MMATYAANAEHDRLATQIKGQMCAACKMLPSVAWNGERHVIRCGCGHGKARLTPRLGRVPERYAGWMETGLMKQQDLTPEIVKQFISKTATEGEVELFVRFCTSQNLNPFRRDAYLVKHENQPAYIVIGVDTLLRKAEMHPEFRGYQSGVIVLKDGKPIEKEGSFHLPDETLVGGWAKFRREGWEPIKVTVNLSEYDKKRATWNTMKGTMIEKTAVSQGCRRGFADADFLQKEAGSLRVEVVEDEDIPEALPPPEAQLDALTEPLPDDPQVTEEDPAADLYPDPPEPESITNGAEPAREPTTAGELFQWALDAHGKSRDEALGALGVESPLAIRDVAKAYGDLVKLWATTP